MPRTLANEGQSQPESFPPNFEETQETGPCLGGRAAMLQEIIPFFPASDSTIEDASRSAWMCYLEEMRRRSAARSGQLVDQFAEEPRFLEHPTSRAKDEVLQNPEKENATASGGRSLFQELFFFCQVKKVGDLPGAECIYVETVVDRDSGLAFAKVYPAKSASNAVDILATRVMPFFQRRGIRIREIYTRKTSEYCGFLPTHPFEFFLASFHIQHMEMDQSSRPYHFLCERFYRLLLKEFFPLALRTSFDLSLPELQRALDAFVETHNAAQTPVKTIETSRSAPL
jgi:hypothetical protein